MKKNSSKIFFSLVVLLLLTSVFSTEVYAKITTSSSITNPNSSQELTILQQKTVTISSKNVDVKHSKSSLLSTDLESGSNSVTVQWYIGFDNIKHTVYDGFKIISIIGIPPVEILIGQELVLSDFANPNLSDYSQLYYGTSLVDLYKNPGARWVGTDIHIGAEVREEVPAKTKFFRLHGSTTALYPGFTVFTHRSRWDTEFIAINRTGNVFPDYIDAFSGKKASDGLRTDWLSVPKENRVIYNNNDRGNAIKDYIDLYGDPHYEWKREFYPNYYEMHHIKPREFGGTNEISNFIPILAKEHEKISGWFKGYHDPNSSSNPDPEIE